MLSIFKALGQKVEVLSEESKVQNIDVKFNVISGRKNVYVGA